MSEAPPEGSALTTAGLGGSRAGLADADLLAASRVRVARPEPLPAHRRLRPGDGAGLKRADRPDPARGHRGCGGLPHVQAEGVAQWLINRYALTGRDLQAVRDALAPSTATNTDIGLIGAVLLAIAILSFARAVQRLFERTWELQPLSVRNSFNDLLWLAGLIAYLGVSGVAHREIGRQSCADRGEPAAHPFDRDLPRLERPRAEREANRAKKSRPVRDRREPGRLRSTLPGRRCTCRTCSARTRVATGRSGRCSR